MNAFRPSCLVSLSQTEGEENKKKHVVVFSLARYIYLHTNINAFAHAFDGDTYFSARLFSLASDLPLTPQNRCCHVHRSAYVHTIAQQCSIDAPPRLLSHLCPLLFLLPPGKMPEIHTSKILDSNKTLTGRSVPLVSCLISPCLRGKKRLTKLDRVKKH